MRPMLLIAVLLASLTVMRATAAEEAAIYERGDWPGAPNAVDAALAEAWRQTGLSPARCCSDAVFIRRLYLDLLGQLPEPTSVHEFLVAPSPGKRMALIDALLQTPEFADYAALRWGDVLRVKSEFPINLWPNAVQAYAHWIREAVGENLPYDQFARALLTSSGSNFRVAPVNFYRAVQGRDPASLAGAAALTFMGTRLSTWPPEGAAQLATFFSRVSYKKTREWKEEIVCLDPAAGGPLSATLPDGSAVSLRADQDPRVAFADWLLKPGNEWFARAGANRVWYWLMGRGVVHEADDLRPPDSPAGPNPPACPALLDCLAGEFARSGYDLRALYRLILSSHAYQQSPVPAAASERNDALFAHYLPRRLEAEVLVDALQWLGGPRESYVSPIPEPFTVLPWGTWARHLTDGSIGSSRLEMFGRPSRDTGLLSERDSAPSEAQRRYLLNSEDVQKLVSQSPRFMGLMATAGRDPVRLAQWTYLTVLSRYPTPAEIATAQTYLQAHGAPYLDSLADLAWALLNTKEFLYQH